MEVGREGGLSETWASLILPNEHGEWAGGGRYMRQMTTSDRRTGKNEVGLVRAALVRISGRTNEPTGEAMPPP